MEPQGSLPYSQEPAVWGPVKNFVTSFFYGEKMLASRPNLKSEDRY
jgi:hypothetical protein